MDFSFSEQELAFADEARAWLEANVPAAWRRDHAWSRAEDPMWITIARDWQRTLFEGGWAAISWPREQGGRGATVIERWLFEEQLDRVGAQNLQRDALALGVEAVVEPFDVRDPVQPFPAARKLADDPESSRAQQDDVEATVLSAPRLLDRSHAAD